MVSNQGRNIDQVLDDVPTEIMDKVAGAAWKSMRSHPDSASCGCPAIEAVATFYELGYRLFEVRTPTEWAKHFGEVIMDPDGWRDATSPSWDTPITKDEYQRRSAVCSKMQDADPGPTPSEPVKTVHGAHNGPDGVCKYGTECAVDHSVTRRPK